MKIMNRIALILLLVLFAGSCSKAPSGPNDSTIGDAVKGRFYSDPQLKAEQIEVTVAGGEVTLKGSVSTEEIRQHAVHLAQGIDGVKKVVDQMQAGTVAAIPSESPGEIPSQPAADTGSAPPPRTYTLAIGTEVRIQMLETVDSKTGLVGDLYRASLESPLVVGEEVVVPKGADVLVKLIKAKRHGKIKGRSELQIALDHMEFQGKAYPLVSTTYRTVGESRGKETAKKTALGAGVGAVVGAIAGGKKGAAIGAGVGAGAGMASQLILKGEQVRIPAETKLDFQLEEPLELTLS